MGQNFYYECKAYSEIVLDFPKFVRPPVVEKLLASNKSAYRIVGKIKKGTQLKISKRIPSVERIITFFPLFSFSYVQKSLEKSKLAMIGFMNSAVAYYCKHNLEVWMAAFYPCEVVLLATSAEVASSNMRPIRFLCSQIGLILHICNEILFKTLCSIELHLVNHNFWFL